MRILARIAAIEGQLPSEQTAMPSGGAVEAVPCVPPEVFPDLDPALTKRIEEDCIKRGVTKHRLTWVPNHYYQQPLEWRMQASQPHAARPG